MLTLIADLAYWGMVGLLGIWAVAILTFIAFCVQDWLRLRRRNRAWRELQRTVNQLIACLPPDPYSEYQDDPLERQFALPSAPDPRRYA